MNKRRTWLLVLALCMCFFSSALADELREGELSAWVDDTLRRTAGIQPMNTPVGEESLTADGYAFLYDFATLYYDLPQLSAQSRLQAFSVTAENEADPRGITLGSTQEELLAAYGSQNPWLLGDGLFAALYRVNELPGAAYWSWAQLDENGQASRVRCAMHVKTGEDRYTDAGVLFMLEDGVVAGIQVYGLDRYLTLADVQANLDAVVGVQQAISGDTPAAEVFSEEDLTFEGLDVRTLSIDALNQLLGEQAQTETISDEEGQMITAWWDGVYYSGNAEGDMDVFSVSTSRLAGPRGIRVGDSLSDVLNLFTGDLEQEGASAVLTCTTPLERRNEWLNLSLHLSFEDECLTEWMLYTW